MTVSSCFCKHIKVFVIPALCLGMASAGLIAPRPAAAQDILVIGGDGGNVDQGGQGGFVRDDTAGFQATGGVGGTAGTGGNPGTQGGDAANNALPPVSAPGGAPGSISTGGVGGSLSGTYSGGFYTVTGGAGGSPGAGGSGGNATLNITSQNLRDYYSVTVTTGKNGTPGPGGAAGFSIGRLSARLINLDKNDGRLSFEVTDYLEIGDFATTLTATGLGPSDTVRINSIRLTGSTGSGNFTMSVPASFDARVGRLIIDGGTLNSTNWGSFISPTTFTFTDPGITLGANGVRFNFGDIRSLDRNLTGSGGLTMEGGGTLTLTGNNAYTGNTTVSSGILEGNIANNTNLRVEAGAIYRSIGVARTVNALDGGGQVVNDISLSVGSGVFNGIITGAGSLIKNGAGVLTLTGNNTYVGGTTVNLGLINFTNSGNFGTGKITLNGGGLQWASGYTGDDISGILNDLGVRGGIFDTNGNNVRLGDVDGPGSLTKTGAGTLTLTGDNKYQGSTVVYAGTLNFDTPAAFVFDGAYVINGGKLDLSGIGAPTMTSLTSSESSSGGVVDLGPASSTVLTVQSGSFSGSVIGKGSLEKTGPGRLTLSGNNTYEGGTIVHTGVLQVGDGGTTGNIVGSIINNANISLNHHTAGNTSVTFSGNISGNGILTRDGEGTVILGGTNTYTGRTIVEQGTLRFGTAGSFINNREYEINGGRLDLNNHSMTMSLLEGTGGDIQLGSAALTVNQGGNTTFGGAILGMGSLVKNGAGTLTLTGKNIYTGGTTVSQGTLAGNTDGLQGSIVNNAALEFTQAVNGTFAGSIRGTGALTMNGTGMIAMDGDVTQRSVLINSGALSLVKGFSLTVTDEIRVTPGARLGITVGSTSMISAGTVRADYGAIFNVDGYSGPGRQTVIETTNGIFGDFILYAAGQSTAPGLNQFMNITLEKINSNRDLVVEQSLVWNQAVNAHGNFYIADGSTPFVLSESLMNNVQPNAGVTYNWDGMSLTKTGTGTLVLSGNNIYTGRTTVSAGTLEVTGRLGNGNYAGPINISNNATLAFVQSDNQTLSGIITGSGNLVKGGLGTLTLTGDNVNTGNVIVNDGMLAGNIGSNATLYLGGKATYDGMGANRFISALNGDGSIVNTRNLTVQSGAFNGIITGSASLDKTGSGTLTLTGKNTYTGGTTVSQGTLIGNTESLQGHIENNSALEFNQAFIGTYVGSISGNNGSLTVNGTGEVTVAGNVTQGSVTISRGASLNIAAGHNMAVYGGDINVGAGARLSVSAGSSPTVTARSLIAAPGAILNINGYAGEGQAVIQTTNGISSDFTLHAGGSELPAPGLNRFLNVYMADNNRTIRQSLVWNQSSDAHGTFNIAGGNNFTMAAPLADNNQSGAGNTYGWKGDSLHKIGMGTLTLTGENTYSGGTVVSAGTLQIGDGGTTGSISGNIVNNANVTFNRSNAVTYGGVISGDGSLTKDGTGTLTLTGNNIYIGDTRVNAGTLAGNIAHGTNLTVAADATYDGLNAARSVNALNGAGRIVNNNGLTAQSGLFSGIIFGSGGLVKAGENTLYLAGANTYTGLTEVRGGTLHLVGGRISDKLALYGDTTFNTGGGSVNLTSLDVRGKSNWHGNLNIAGQTMNFYLPDTMAKDGTMLTVSGSANITNSTVNVDVAGESSPLQLGDKVTLISAGSLNGAPVNSFSNGEGMHGVTLKYNFNITTENDSLLATVTTQTVNEQTKALSTGFLGGGLALTSQGSNLIDWRGINEAVSAAWRTGDSGSGSGIFAAFSAGTARYDVGSRMDLSNVALMAGLAWGEFFNPTRLTFGTFFEYGGGSYHAYDSFADSAPVTGNGDAHYIGGGFLGRMDSKAGRGNFYTEASFRVGVANNEYVGANMGPYAGRGVSYDSSSAYFGLHFGTGYLWNINDKTSLDMFGKHFWTRQQGDSVTLSTGDPVKFDNADSHRLRTGGRLSFAANEIVETYAGAAYEYEHSGDMRASTSGYDMDAPSLRGGTFVGEFGLTLKLFKTRPLFFDLGMRSYGGKSSGVMGSIRAGHDTGEAMNQFWGNLYLNLLGRFEF